MWEGLFPAGARHGGEGRGGARGKGGTVVFFFSLHVGSLIMRAAGLSRCMGACICLGACCCTAVFFVPVESLRKKLTGYNTPKINPTDFFDSFLFQRGI